MLYFDTSFLVPLVLPETTSARIAAFVSELNGEQLAIASNHRAGVIYSLDKTLLDAGSTLGLPVSMGIRQADRCGLRQSAPRLPGA